MFSFPTHSFGAGRPWSQRGLAGRAYGEIAPELADALLRWLDSGHVPEGETLEPPHVFRSGELVIKFFPAPSVFGWLRRARAVRSAELHFRCLPVASPRPLIAVARNRRGPSLLVREFVPGALLWDVWSRDERAEAELPAFLALMQRHGVLHGDLHPHNLLWNGERWLLLDVDGLRHGLHSRSRVLEGQWTRLCFYLRDERRVERLFARTRELGPGTDPTDWSRVRQRARRMRRARGLPAEGETGA